MKTIAVLGYYNKLNIGDDSYKLSFPKLFPNYKFTFSDTLKEAETIILGGGDVLCPYFIDIIKKFPQAKKYALSVNLRPENIEYIPLFDRIISRNLVNNITCYPDFAFILEGNKERGKQLLTDLFNKHDCDLYENVVIITMNSFLCRGESVLARDRLAFDKTCYDLAKLTDNISASFIYLPFGNGFPHNDRIANSLIYTYCKYWKKNLLLFDNLEIQDYLDIFAAVDAAIVTRLHAGIFSCIGEIPFININHHTKTQFFMDSIGKPDWCVDYWHFEYHKTKELLEDFLRNKEFYKNEVHKINMTSKELLSKVIL